MTVYLKCDRCPYEVRVDGAYQDAIERLDDHRDRAHTQSDSDLRADGGHRELAVTGDLRYRVTFTCQGVQFQSDPLDRERAHDLATAISDATVPIDLGERPLADDEHASLDSVEVPTDDE